MSAADDERAAALGKLFLALLAALPADEARGTLAEVLRAQRELAERLAAIEQRLPAELALDSLPSAAAKLEVSLASVKRLVKSGALPSTRLGAKVYVDLREIRAIRADEIARMAASARAGRKFRLYPENPGPLHRP